MFEQTRRCTPWVHQQLGVHREVIQYFSTPQISPLPRLNKQKKVGRATCTPCPSRRNATLFFSLVQPTHSKLKPARNALYPFLCLKAEGIPFVGFLNMEPRWPELSTGSVFCVAGPIREVLQVPRSTFNVVYLQEHASRGSVLTRYVRIDDRKSKIENRF